ncbi:SNF2 family helicase [Mycena chlorophos]|uniref:SNF2 family helicase n=1 Tax=Mycena chlorophos TaxID=658473 RepID=A0A8H6RZF3_MYCCL|nr:SNF2 family helicase [Mycena chlorophos]
MRESTAVLVLGLSSLESSLLVQLLQAHAPTDASAKGKRRAASPDNARPSKRRRTQRPVSSASDSDESTSQDSHLPAFTHEYTLRFDEDGQEDGAGHLLQALGLLPNEAAFDLGEISFGARDGRVYVVLERDAAAELLALPPLRDEIDLEAFGIMDGHSDVISASLRLESYGRAVVRGQISLSPSNAGHNVLPFTLTIGITVSFTPAIFDPDLATKPKARQMGGIEDAQRRVLQFAFPDPKLNASNAVTNIPFFYAALGPAPASHSSDAIAPEGLAATLLPFQRRSVEWLLQREGVSPDGSQSRAFSFWERIEDKGQRSWFVNRLTGACALEKPEEPPALGAILAEEPGLGKTVEIIALLLLNPAPPEIHPDVKHWDDGNELEVAAVKANLIVTPVSLSNQWISELKLHAPSLKVLLYEGWNKLAMMIDDQDAAHDWPSYCQQFDVVIATYSTLRADLNVARVPPKRPRREDVVYSNIERERSPLIRVEWQRVIMDEVQMVGGGNVEDMVSMIPRRASFAVSGTPARAQVADLSHVLKFLRVNHLIGPAKCWNRLLLPAFSNYFAALFSSLAIRTTKASVKNELTIPQQTRYIVGIEMGPVERAVYDADFDRVLLELGLDARGVDVHGEQREPDAALLRSMIRRLRAICTHPQVGQLGNKLFGKQGGALKTMDQVLQSMRTDNWGLVVEDSKNKIHSLIRLAQLQQQGAERNRHQVSLETLILAEKEATQLLQEIESAIAAHEASAPSRGSKRPSPAASGKGKERERSMSPLSDIDSDSEDEGDGDDSEQNAAVKQYRARKSALKNRLREAQLVMHRVKFLQGDANHTLGQADAETAAYDAAEAIRRVLLSTVEQEATRAMKMLDHVPQSQPLSLEQLLINTPFFDDTSDDDALDEANEIIEDVLNQQSTLLWTWRTRLTELLTRKLTPGEEADGEEYQRTLDDQGEAESYLVNYTALASDRREALLKERSLLATHDAAEKKTRVTKAAIRAAAALDELPKLDSNIELAPEHEVLFKELSLQRKALLNTLEGRALKTIVVDLAARIAKTDKSKDKDQMRNLKTAHDTLRQLITDQGPILDKLDSDLVIYRKVFNTRIRFFRQLQEISDAVADVTFETTLAEALIAEQTQQRDLAAKISTQRARQRYLEHLTKHKHTMDDDSDDEENACILCKCSFTRGFLTDCAHVFCEDCFKLWAKDKIRSTCPVCRVAINFDKLQRFVVAEETLKPTGNNEDEVEVPKSRRVIEYNTIDPALLRKIQATAAFGDYGEKIATLVKHLIYLREVDAGAKSIVFSAWQDSLFIVERALRANGISCIRIDQNRKGQTAVSKFASDDDIEVLLLHGERENAGLNVTCASRVFLLESVVHHSFEVQAIARIDRMGQTKPTEVFCYYAQDSVEKNILDIAARQGLSLYTKNNSIGSILDVSSLTEDESKKLKKSSPAKKKLQSKGDFILKIEDMMAIIFPHMFEDIDYMVPEDAMEVETEPVAGPSRL